MISTADDAAIFRAECLKWQKRLGLTDWALTFRTATDSPDGDTEALCDYDCDTRKASLVYYIGVPDADHPADNAQHEMLHLLLADMLLLATVDATTEEDPRVAREEHRVIERLRNVLK